MDETETTTGGHWVSHQRNHAQRRFIAKSALREAVKNAYAAGQTMREIAADRGISLGSVYRLLHQTE